MPSNHLILCHPLLLLHSIFPNIRDFSSESALHIRWPKFWSFTSASVLRMNIQGWFHLGLAGLISLLSKGLSGVFSSTIIGNYQFFSTQPSVWSISHLHMITGKTIALTVVNFVRKAMSLVFNMLSRFVIALLPRSKCLLISWLQSLSAVILKPRKMKSDTISIFPPSICLEVMAGPPKMERLWWRVLTKCGSWRREWQSTSHSCIKTPMISMKQQKDFRGSYLDLGHSLESVREDYVGGGLS